MTRSNTKLYSRFLLLAIISLGAGYASVVSANTFTVNSTADMVDANPGDGKCETGRDAPGVVPAAKECTLRAAVQESNALAGKDEIALPSGKYILSQPTQCTIRVNGNPSYFRYNIVTLCVATQMTISGAGASTTIIDGGNQDRVFLVSADAEAEIRGATIQNGVGYGGTDVFGGGGINNQGKLTLSETALNTNRAEARGGGGIINLGTLTVNKSTFVGNTAIPNIGSGGGIYNGGELTVTDSLFSGNTASNVGGGIAIFGGNVTITGSTFSDNVANTAGGGIGFTPGTLTLTNSTLSGNSSYMGGGLYVRAGSHDVGVNLNNATITQNRSQWAGGGITDFGGNAKINLKNTIIAGNTADQAPETSDCSGVRLTSQGYNLIQNAATCRIQGNTTGNITGKHARLGALSNNGGLTPTHALLSDSPAIDAGNPSAPGSGGTACAAADQRGVLRPVGSSCDIGAFEREGTFSVRSSLPNRGGNTASVTVTISGSGFKDGATIKLRRAGEADIAGAPVAVEAGGSSLTTSFDLNRKALGAWDVVVTNPEGTSTTLSNGFTIEETKAPQLWSQIVGRNAIRPGLPAKYNIIYGNRGNVDAHAVPLTISVPANLQLNVYFQFTPPPTQAGQVPTNWSEVPVHVLPGRATGANTTAIFLLPVIPAGSTGALRISVLLPPDAQHGDIVTFAAYLGDPYFDPNLDAEILDGMVAGAQSYSQKSLGVTIPPALIPELKRYATTQLQSLVESGRQSLVESLGTQPEVYSLAHLNFDLARFGAARATSGNTSFIEPFNADNFQASAPNASSISPLAGKAGGKSNPCAGRVLAEGQICSDNPNPIPAPDKVPPGPPGIPPGDCNQIPNHKISDDGQRCIPKDRKGCPIFQNPFTTDPDCATYPIRNSVDPNDKVGAPGATVKRFLPGATPFTYTIFFENLPTATAAAQVVTITDQLDTVNLDLNTFSFGSVSFDKYTVTPPPGKSEFVAALDLRPASNLIVTIDARLDRNTGVLTWRFTSLDPETQQPTDDPDAGFLAPNRTSPEGEGSVTFFVSPKSGLATNTEIRNKARIVFDVNAPIDTPEWLNTIDNAPPASRVQTLPPRQNTQSFTVNWAGTDAGAGINSYSVYVSQNGGPFTPFLTDTPLTSATFNGTLGSTYAFYSVASDLAGNVEPAKTAAEATTTLAATPNVQFSAANYSVGEGDGRVSVTVTRTGDTTAAASVNYQTADADTFTVGCTDAVGAGGAAYGRCDFSTTFGTLSFAAGETAKTITVPLINDGHVEGPETFQLRLSNPTGAALGVISTATVTITDNDTAGTPNPIITLSPSDFPFFVRQQYLDFLSREPEASEPWTAVMNRCANVNTGPATDTDCDRIAVSGAFFGSPEFRLKGFYVFRFYKLAFNRLPQYTEITSDMSFVAGATAAEVYARKAQLATAFVARPEFQAAYGALSNADYVQALMARAGRSQITTFDPVNPDGTAKVTLTSVELINKLNNNALTRAQVLRAIADSDEVGAAEYNNAFVAVQYYGYLRRTPDDNGYQAWLRVINQDPNNVRIMINGFMNSTEYRLRFGLP